MNYILFKPMNQEIKLKGAEFWNANPCGGEWFSFQDQLKWLLEREPHIQELIRDDIFLNKEVLDVGSGQGAILSLIAQKAKKAVGIDMSSQSLKMAEKGILGLGLDNVELRGMDAENLLFEDQSFDVVFCHGVLHHTENPQKGIDEIKRVLRRDGKAVVMLYRKWCPKGIAVMILRFFSKMVDIGTRKNYYIASRLKKNSSQGTALFELFGCPVLKTYSKRQIKKMFSDFSDFKIYFREPGFSRLTDFIFKKNKFIKKAFKRLDKINSLGFYIIIEANAG